MIYSIERDSPRGAYHLFELQRESTFTVPFRHWQDVALFGAYERPKLSADSIDESLVLLCEEEPAL